MVLYIVKLKWKDANKNNYTECFWTIYQSFKGLFLSKQSMYI